MPQKLKSRKANGGEPADHVFNSWAKVEQFMSHHAARCSELSEVNTKDHFDTDWRNCKAIKRLGLHPIRPVAFVKFYERSRPLLHIKLGVECEEGYITDDEIELSMTDPERMISMAEILRRANEIRSGRESLLRATREEDEHGCNGPGIREVSTVGVEF